MSNAMIIFLVIVILTIYNLLLHIIDRKIYIEKISCLRVMFDRISCSSSLFEDKNTLVNFLVKIENDLNDIV